MRYELLAMEGSSRGSLCSFGSLASDTELTFGTAFYVFPNFLIFKVDYNEEEEKS